MYAVFCLQPSHSATSAENSLSSLRIWALDQSAAEVSCSTRRFCKDVLLDKYELWTWMVRHPVALWAATLGPSSVVSTYNGLLRKALVERKSDSCVS